MFKLGLEKSRGTRDLIANIHWITEKGREFQKISTSASLTMLKTLTVWIYNRKIFKEMGIPDLLSYFLRNLRVKNQQLELDMKKWIGSKLGKD